MKQNSAELQCQECDNETGKRVVNNTSNNAVYSSLSRTAEIFARL